MFIPNEVLQGVFFLACKTNADREPIISGSSFLVGHPLGDTGKSTLYAVTARHCIESFKERSCDAKVHLRMNVKGGDCRLLETSVDSWLFHPTNDCVDVAVMPLRYFSDLDHLMIQQESFATPAVIEDLQIGIGDETFVVGLFKEHFGKRRNSPIARAGNIAAFPDEQVSTRDYGNMEAYLVECRSIGGLSGSPVFVVVDEFLRIPPGTSPVKASTSRTCSFRLLGLMHGHWDNPDSDPSEDSRSGSINMGIAVVVPAKFILETIDHPALVAEREKMIQEIRSTTNLPVED